MNNKARYFLSLLALSMGGASIYLLMYVRYVFYDSMIAALGCTNDIAGAASAGGVCKNAAVISGKDVNKVVLTGGVFQNRILTELTLELLRKDGFETYYNVSVSPNDGGIALGQNYVALHKLALH